MKVYIPFNMIIDTDFGMIRLIEKIQDIHGYSVNKLKSFLINRENENPISEYNKLRQINIIESAYDLILDKYYQIILPLSSVTDMVAFVINTYKLGLSNEVEITIGCDLECEIEYLKSILSELNYSFDIQLNIDIDLNEYDCIFTKFMDKYYVDDLLNRVKIKGKRIYVADYRFNTLYDTENKLKIIDPELHMRLESEGNIISLVSLYNKKQ